MSITVYTLPSCVQCDQTKKYLTREGVAFKAVDASTDTDAMDYIKSLGYASAPVVVLGDGRMVSDRKGEVIVHWYGLRPDLLKQLVESVKDHDTTDDAVEH